ncbi:MAG: hypothetical protein M5U28_34465 [Sandaracinaceae bacterium]|nr:hypothetical protein [Sandaracinaceae bacterium]
MLEQVEDAPHGLRAAHHGAEAHAGRERHARGLPRVLEGDAGGAHAQDGAGVQEAALDLHALDEGAVGAAEVREADAPRLDGELAVEPRDRAVGEAEVGRLRASRSRTARDP